MSDKVQKITIRGEFKTPLTTLFVKSCQVSAKARMIRHPVENGWQGLFDDKVIDPRTITIQAEVYADDEEVKRKLRDMWRNREFEFYTVTTREATYNNFACTECSHTEDSEKLNMLNYTIRYEEVMQSVSATKPSSPDDANVGD